MTIFENFFYCRTIVESIFWIDLYASFSFHPFLIELLRVISMSLVQSFAVAANGSLILCALHNASIACLRLCLEIAWVTCVLIWFYFFPLLNDFYASLSFRPFWFFFVNNMSNVISRTIDTIQANCLCCCCMPFACYEPIHSMCKWMWIFAAIFQIHNWDTS